MLTLTPTVDLESPISLACMYSGRKPQYLEKKHACTGRICKLHTERLQLWLLVFARTGKVTVKLNNCLRNPSLKF